MTATVAETCLVPPTAFAAQYETLRMAALGEALPPEARSGLMLFLSRGMWQWTRTLAAESVREEPTPMSGFLSRLSFHAGLWLSCHERLIRTS